MVFQAVKTISKLVVEEDKVEIQLTYIVYWTPKDCQAGEWIAKKSLPFMIRNNKGTPHW